MAWTRSMDHGPSWTLEICFVGWDRQIETGNDGEMDYYAGCIFFGLLHFFSGFF